MSNYCLTNLKYSFNRLLFDKSSHAQAVIPYNEREFTLKKKMFKLANLAVHTTGNYATWLICIILAAKNYLWWGTLLSAAIIIAQIIWQYLIVKQTHYLWTMLLLFTIGGSLVDSGLMWAGLIHYHANAFYPFYTAPWMLCLWAEFGIVFYALLPAWHERYFLIGLLALPLFPFAYFVGAKIGAASIFYPVFTLSLLGIIWAIGLPLLLSIFNFRRRYA